MQFDQPLRPNGPAHANFAVTHANLDRVITGVRIVGDVLEIAADAGLTFLPPNGISYFATPPELFGLTGEPVAPFVKVPFL